MAFGTRLRNLRRLMIRRICFTVIRLMARPASCGSSRELTAAMTLLTVRGDMRTGQWKCSGIVIKC
jgi:hypothetical protein